jgi:cation transport regulator ChaC
MGKFTCSINKKKILEAVKNHDCYDSWGEVMYMSGRQGVEYNICIDNSTEETKCLSAFYRLSKGKDGWQNDGSLEWYAYEIDFSDNNWKEKLKDAAKQAFEYLWKKEKNVTKASKEDIVANALNEAKQFTKDVRYYLYETEQKRPLADKERELWDQTHYIHVHTEDAALIMQENNIQFIQGNIQTKFSDMQDNVAVKELYLYAEGTDPFKKQCSNLLTSNVSWLEKLKIVRKIVKCASVQYSKDFSYNFSKTEEKAVINAIAKDLNILDTVC